MQIFKQDFGRIFKDIFKDFKNSIQRFLINILEDFFFCIFRVFQSFSGGFLRNIF